MFILAMLCGAIYAGHYPPETVILTLPDENYAGWKEIARGVSKKEGVIECIPVSQEVENWSELISIQYKDRADINREAARSIEAAVDCLRKTTVAAYPGNKVTWTILEKNKSDILYEWILHESYQNIPPQHELARAFLTEQGLHRVGFVRQNREMSAEEREKWIKSLRKSAVVSIEEASKTPQGLSLVDDRYGRSTVFEEHLLVLQNRKMSAKDPSDTRPTPQFDREKIACALLDSITGETAALCRCEIQEDAAWEKELKKHNASSERKIYGPYILILNSLQHDVRFKLYTCNLLGVDCPAFGLNGYIDTEGKAWFQGDTREDHYAEHVKFVGNTLPGEPTFDVIVFGNHISYLVASIVANPLAAEGKEGRRVEMIIASCSEPLYLIKGEGFKNGEEIIIQGTANGMPLKHNCTASEKGHFHLLWRGDPKVDLARRDLIEVTSSEQPEPISLAYGWEFLKAYREGMRGNRVAPLKCAPQPEQFAEYKYTRSLPLPIFLEDYTHAYPERDPCVAEF